MQESSRNTHGFARVQARVKYTPDETALIEQIAGNHVEPDELRQLFPGRTLSAIKLRLRETRRIKGLTIRNHTKGYRREMIDFGGSLDPNDPGLYCSYAERREKEWTRGSAMLLQAIQQMRSA